MFEADDDRITAVVQKPKVIEMIYCSNCFEHFGCKTDKGIYFCDKSPSCPRICNNTVGTKLKLVFGECSGFYAENPGSFFLLEEGLCIL